jgi:uracil-DNA glycosylase
MPFLKEQTKYIKPEIIALMGQVASQTPREEDIRYIETCHPAAAMRFPKMRKKFEKAVKTLSSHMTH